MTGDMILEQTGEKAFAERDWPGMEPLPHGAAILATAGALAQSQRARIFRFLFYSLREREVAEELTQDVLLAVWRARESFRGESSAETWVMRIAVNTLRNHTRTGRFKFWRRMEKVEIGDLLTPPPDPARSAEQTLLAEERLRAVWRAADRLSERQRSVFLLHFVEEMEAREIADATGMALSTVKTHLYRAIDSVKAAVKSANEEGVR
jgi:RNA polymerase sigma-70 factor (ECF subfamily)